MRAELADGTVLEFPDDTDPAVVQATVKKMLGGAQAAPAAPARPEPSNLAVANNAGWKGLASIPDMVLNTPNNLLNLGKAAVGQVPLAMGRPDLAPHPTANPDFVRRGMEHLGLIKPENDPVTGGQRVIDAAMQGATTGLVSPSRAITGAVTGALGGAAGQATTEATDSPVAGAAVGMATPYGVQGAGALGRQRMADAALAQSRNQVRDATLKAGQVEGYVTPPSAVNPTGLNKVLESIAGKEAVKQQSSINNQAVTTDLAAKDLGFPKGTPMTMATLESFRYHASAPYRELAAISPAAEATLFQLREARQRSVQYHKWYDRSADPNALQAAKMYEGQASNLEQRLDQLATRAGRPDLVPDMKEARQKLAKSYDVEKSLNTGTGEVVARNLGQQLDQGKPLTGNLHTAAAYEQAFPKYMAEGSTVPTPGVSKLGAYGSGALGAVGLGSFGPPGLALGALPLASSAARHLVLSQPYQKMFAQPNYNQGQWLGQIPQMDPALQSILLGNQLQ